MAEPDRWRQGPGLLESTWRYRWLVAAGLVVGAVAGYFLGASEPVTYEATSQLVLLHPDERGIFREDSSVSVEQYMAQQAERLAAGTVLDRAATELGAGDAASIRRRLEISSDDDLLLIEITAAARDAQAAADLANAVAQAYQDDTRERILADAQEVVDQLENVQASVQEQVDQLQRQLQAATGGAGSNDAVLAARLQNLAGQIVELESRAQQIAVDAEVTGSGVEFFEPATVPENPVAPRPMRVAILGAVLGAALAAAFSYWRSGQTTRIRSRSHPAAILGVPLLGEVPTVTHEERDQAVNDPQVVEAYQFVLSSIEFALAAIDGHAVLVTSPLPMPARSLSAILLAAAAARDGRSVVLVDGDLRSRQITARLGLWDAPGLRELVASEATLEQSLHGRAFGPDAPIRVLPSGRIDRETPSFLRSPAFRETFEVVDRLGDLVIFDAAPLLSVADTSVMAGHVDGVVLVIPADLTIERLEQVRERMQFVAAPLLGYVYVTPERSFSSEAPPPPERITESGRMPGLRRRRETDERGVAIQRRS